MALGIGLDHRGLSSGTNRGEYSYCWTVQREGGKGRREAAEASAQVFRSVSHKCCSLTHHIPLHVLHTCSCRLLRAMMS